MEKKYLPIFLLIILVLLFMLLLVKLIQIDEAKKLYEQKKIEVNKFNIQIETKQ